jgi:predicted HD phosphohydrolase
MYKMDEIIELYKNYGSLEYIGENLTQIQHSIQAGILALHNKEENDVILACFLHDIGHLIGIKNKNNIMEYEGLNYGIENHENVGADYLKSLGMNDLICDLVRNHVNAKRYLAPDTLSGASKITLKLQGGVMNEDERKKFEQNINFHLYLKVRHYDDLAKLDNFPSNIDEQNKYLEIFRNLPSIF